MKPSWKCLLIGVVLAVTLSTVAPQANAQWYGGCCGGGAYWRGCCMPYLACNTAFTTPCCGTIGCYSPCANECGYLGWRPGPARRLLFGPCRWYWNGCYSLCDSCCSTVTSTISSGCSSCGNAAPAVAPSPAPTPAKKPVAEPAPAPATPAPPVPVEPKTTGLSADESGFLTIWVPYDAKVTVNGMETKSQGSRRQFVSFGLKPGLSYKYVVKAEVVRDGQLQEDTRTVILTAGEISAVAFGFNVPSQQVASAQ